MKLLENVNMNKNNDCSKSRKEETKAGLHRSLHSHRNCHSLHCHLYYREPAKPQGLPGLRARTDGVVRALGCDNDVCVHRLCAHLFDTSVPIRKTLHPRDDGGEKARA